MDVTKEDLQALRSLSTPTVSNAVELFNVRPRNQGFLSPEIRCLFPDLGVMVGYAVTARFAAAEPATNLAPRYDFWKHVLEVPEPRVVVMQDLDQPSGVGAYFGEVQSTIHHRLGCVGVITNGHVRDLDEAYALGFHYFAGGVCVSHAYVHLTDFGAPVKVGGLVVQSGDLIHADKHGAMIIPLDVVHQIPAGALQVTKREQQITALCKSPDFSLEKLRNLYSTE